MVTTAVLPDLIADRFWAKVEVAGPDDYWRWTGATTRGYGDFWLDGATIGAHRWVYGALVGSIPAGLHLDHRCHNAAKAAGLCRTCRRGGC